MTGDARHIAPAEVEREVVVMGGDWVGRAAFVRGAMRLSATLAEATG